MKTAKETRGRLKKTNDADEMKIGGLVVMAMTVGMAVGTFSVFEMEAVAGRMTQGEAHCWQRWALPVFFSLFH